MWSTAAHDLHDAIPHSHLVDIASNGRMDWFSDGATLVDLTRQFLGATA